jgi:hypothetical protein
MKSGLPLHTYPENDQLVLIIFAVAGRDPGSAN